MASQKKPRKSKNNEWGVEAKVVAGIIMAIGAWFAFVKALRHLVNHPTLGNWARATLATLNLAES